MQVSLNMAMSMDGKIATPAREAMKMGSDFDARRMSEIRSLHDAVINGASTFAVYPFPLKVRGKTLMQQRIARGQSPQPISAIVSSRLAIRRNTPWEKEKAVARWVFCGREAPLHTIRSLEKKGVEVVRSRGLRPSPQEILKKFSAAGVKRLLLEGGGEFNASFVELGLVDTIHLTLVPVVIGGVRSPTWLEGKGFRKGSFPRFRLESCQQVGDELYLTYKRR